MMNQKLDFMHKGHIDIYKTNESKLMIHVYTYTNRAPPIFTVCGYYRNKGMNLLHLITCTLYIQSTSTTEHFLRRDLC